jgi:hypothetical protein
MDICKQCGQDNLKIGQLYCSNKCQNDFQYNKYINEWKSNKVNGSRGIVAKNISKHVRRFLLEKFDNSCTLCGWNKINLSTSNVPVEIDHIDGDSDNNTEYNLRLICPNCHSLTKSYRNLNKGYGRVWRRNKYIKNLPT